MLLCLVDRFFPEKIARKIKLLRLVLNGDCHFENFIKIFPDKIMDDELALLKNNLDEKSLRNIDRFLQLQSYSNLVRDRLDISPFIIVDCSKIETNDPDELVKFRNLGHLAVKKYRFFGHKIKEYTLVHGLTELSSTALDYIKDKDFIDAGAFEGESNLLLQEYGPRKIYSFEPSQSLFSKFTKTLTQAGISSEKYKLESIALGDINQTISFFDSGTTSSRCGVGNSQVEMMRLDDYQKKNGLNIGFIKADVEGFGVNMLKGMIETLHKFRPVLSLSIYHNKDEFLNIKLLLEQFNLNYKFKIIYLNPEVATRELCILAIPEEVF